MSPRKPRITVAARDFAQIERPYQECTIHPGMMARASQRSKSKLRSEPRGHSHFVGQNHGDTATLSAILLVAEMKSPFNGDYAAAESSGNDMMFFPMHLPRQ